VSQHLKSYWQILKHLKMKTKLPTSWIRGNQIGTNLFEMEDGKKLNFEELEKLEKLMPELGILLFTDSEFEKPKSKHTINFSEAQ
jgi:hypothetical protein